MDIWSSQKAYSEAPKRPTLKLSNDLNSNLLNDRFGACKRVNSELANNALIIIVRFSGTPPYPPLLHSLYKLYTSSFFAPRL